MPAKKKSSLRSYGKNGTPSTPRSGEGAAPPAPPKIDRPPGTLSNGPNPVKSPNDRPTAAKALATEEQQEAFCLAVVEHAGIKPACDLAYGGMNPAGVFYWAGQHRDFRDKLNAALAAVYETQVNETFALTGQLLAMSPEQMNLCANAYRIAVEQRIRLLGKLSPIYADKMGAGSSVTHVTNTAVIVDEETRKRLIELRDQILLKDRAPARADVIEVEP